ncbi:probable serine hydrolase [Drosophila guanche]|uniref:Blast:Probable serine hydrolase n=1 Tax=Drosophila guanche TaxID=7266 RepID=A0A3B0K005_DROGU|nr:probable serine hydrolase [Drosophila guanche]SPP87645.1 blast:Probable serine hydrolase [Drosophila guanche]
MGTLSLTDYEEVKIPVPWGHISGRWHGNRTERPILAIHGWLDNLGTFDRLIPLLPDCVGLLCIDLPGHGRSSRLQPGLHYSVHDYVFIIPRVMKEYGWHKVSLMGHSLGGIIAFVYAALAPHTVDMIISLDILRPLPSDPRGKDVDTFRSHLEKHLVEDERQELGKMREPPSYTLPELRKVLAKGSYNSVPPKDAQHLLYRQVAKSQLYPDRFYFSRDARVKYYYHMYIDDGLAAELARRIKRKPYLIIKGSLSPFVGPHCDEPMSILRQNNPHFEFHVVEGTHHAHLHNAEECAKHIVPFIRHHRPPHLTSWSLTGKESQLSSKERRRAQEQFFARSKQSQQRSKL